MKKPLGLHVGTRMRTTRARVLSLLATAGVPVALAACGGFTEAYPERAATSWAVSPAAGRAFSVAIADSGAMFAVLDGSSVADPSSIVRFAKDSGEIVWQTDLASELCPAGDALAGPRPPRIRALLDEGDEALWALAYGCIDDSDERVRVHGARGDGLIIAELSQEDGSILRAHHFGGPVEPVRFARIAPRDLVIVGTLMGRVPLGFGGDPLAADGHDMFVMRVRPDEGAVWATAYGGQGLQEGASVAVDVDGRVIVTGRFDESGEFKGRRFAQQDLEMGCAFCQGPIGTILVAHDAETGAITAAEQRFETVGVQRSTQVRAAPDGGLVLLSLLNAQSSKRMCIERLEPWNSGPIRTRWQGCRDVNVLHASAVLTSAGDAIVAGTMTLHPGADQDLGGGAFEGSASTADYGFAARYAARDGGHRWSQIFGMPGEELTGEHTVYGANTYVRSLGVDREGAIVIAGHYLGRTRIGDEALSVDPGAERAFVAKLTPP